MKIILGTDHRGTEIVKELCIKLKEKGYEAIMVDKENYDTDDYPDFAFKLCDELLKNKYDLGVLICRTGIGMSIAANKVKGIRCARVVNKEDVELTKLDNDSNVLAIGYNLGLDKVVELIETYLNYNEIRDERHNRRINKIISYENGEYNEY